jgi:hypothetical protein
LPNNPNPLQNYLHPFSFFLAQSRHAIPLAILFFCAAGCSRTEPEKYARAILASSPVVRPISEEESAMLRPIELMYRDFKFPKYAIVDGDTSRTLLMCAYPPHSLGNVSSYQVYLVANSPIVGYDFSGENGLQGRGFFMLSTDHIGRSEVICDSLICTTNFWGDGQLWDTREEPNENYLALKGLFDKKLESEGDFSIADFTNLIPGE